MKLKHKIKSPEYDWMCFLLLLAIISLAFALHGQLDLSKADIPLLQLIFTSIKERERGGWGKGAGKLI